MAVLEMGVETLQWNASLQNTPKNRALLTAARKLLTNAQQSQQVNPEPSFSFSPLWQDFINTSDLDYGYDPYVGSGTMGGGGGQQVGVSSLDPPNVGLPMRWHEQGQGLGRPDVTSAESDLESFFANLLEPQQSSGTFAAAYSQLR